MFKHLTRTLKLGLTTLTILTAGAGAAFAQPAGFDTAIDPIDDCSRGGFRKPSYCTTAVVNCITAPFDSGCARTLGTKAHTVAKVRYCGNQDVPSDESAVSAHACSDTWGGANAANWAKQNPDALTTPTANRHQFLKGTADGVDIGDFRIWTNRKGALYFDTATFDGRALGGDATDGVAFFLNSSGYFYAGILSGTDLGAPITQTSGTASWVGQFQATHLTTNKDFVLEVTFGGIGDVAGSIEALVYRQSGSDFYNALRHFYLKGDFDDSGLITGTIVSGTYTNNDRNHRLTGSRYPGILTGLIGQEGAVGVFHSNGGWYVGGFVARPPTTEPKEGETYTETKFLNDTCSADPFTNKHQNLCYLEYADDRAIINCITGGNASSAECRTVREEHSCISNPFDTKCVTDFADYYVAARAKRNEFCVGDLNNSLCTGTGAKDAICTYAPFASICFDDNEYKGDRETKYPTCHADPSIPSCTGVTDRPNAIAWADSFETALSDRPAPPTDGTTRGNQFLKGTASGINRGDIVVPTSSPASGSLNLNTAEFNGEDLGGDAADGVAFFYGRVNGQGTRYFYSGIFSGTDLGAPVTDLSGTASWVGRFQVLNQTVNKEFVLEIDFDGTGDKAGFIKAFVQQGGLFHFYLDGYYNAHGVITGTVNYGRFTDNDRKDTTGFRHPGTLTGLIGQEGAVGAFISNDTGVFGYSGGFVARPPTDDDLDHLDITCDDDPFHPFCQLVREDQERNDHIIDCIADNGAETDSEFCRRAVIRNPCLANPFTANCATDLSEQYEDAQENRISFCNDPDNKDEPLCGGALITGICEHDPFIAVCFGNGDYNAARIVRAKVCAGPNDDGLSCLGVLSRPNVISFLNSFAEEPPLEPNASLENQFLKGGATELNDGDFTGIRAGNLTLADSLEDGTGLGGDAVDGVAFFAIISNSRYPHYAGILSGTDLGGPLPPTTPKDVTMIWKGRFKAIGSSTYATETDFDLEVTYTGGDEISGKIEAFVQKSGSRHYHLQGNFNTKGVIVGGTVDYARYTDNLRDKIIPKTSNRTGELRGLIGQEGAVGAFIADMRSSSGYFSGGFVARPPE